MLELKVCATTWQPWTLSPPAFTSPMLGSQACQCAQLFSWKLWFYQLPGILSVLKFYFHVNIHETVTTLTSAIGTPAGCSQHHHSFPGSFVIPNKDFTLVKRLLLTVPSNSSFQFVLCGYFRHKQAYNVCLFRSDSFLLVSFFFRACLCRTYIKFHSFLWLNNIPLHKYATFLLIFLF